MTFFAVMHLFVTWFGAGMIIGVLCLLGWWLIPELPWFTHRARLGLLTVGVASLSATFVYGYAFMGGYRYAINQVAARNQEAVHAVNKAIGSVQDCIDRGGEWDTVDGVCRE